MTKPLVSIIIVDYKKDNPYLKESLNAIAKQTFKNYEIILLTDYPVSLSSPKLRKISYGKYIGPAKKRDDGAKAARGSVLAFLDDDAFPSKNWLKEIISEYQDKNVVAVGGPGLTPPDVSWQEEASGWASASPLGSGTYKYRFIPGKRQFVDDFPSMNLSVRRKEFLSIGGFDSNYWPGEDTKLCLDLTS
jgi:cellulose synthase/poly-beta-1,6-N-acetylglucosamine synthase-like glycosyltransferase